ncbi:hypothetical protein WDZ17_12780 [Pseudokineococcus basanitobsidens]|uniref:SAF domain-containing protein n=1 Tax=Pseudokineococcus basanitobsidens TaxID=1926649 RepID=A0ABU8RM52_9ACTN
MAVPDRSGAPSAVPRAGAPARRVAVPSWRDPRLAVGVLLVLAAVVAGSRVVAAADRTVPVYAAAQVLTPGEPVGADDLDVVRVRVDGGAGAGAYVAADESSGGGAPEGLVALRGVGAGELVPAAALGAAGSVEVRPVGVPVTGALPDGLVPGALVDVWVTAVDPTTPGARLDPRRVVASAPVAEVDDDAGGLGTAAATTVQVLVGPSELPDVLAALAADSRVALVLSPGGGSGAPAGQQTAQEPREAAADETEEQAAGAGADEAGDEQAGADAGGDDAGGDAPTSAAGGAPAPEGTAAAAPTAAAPPPAAAAASETSAAPAGAGADG